MHPVELLYKQTKMSKNKQQVPESGFENVEQALSRTEHYIEENRKSLSIILAVIVLVVGGYMMYNRLLLEPKEGEAQSQIYRAEQYFEQDSFLLALEGDGDALGLIEIIDEYGITSTANLAQYYAGISYLRLGEFENAIEHLKQFDSDDKLITVIALGALGDAYVELDDYEEAISFYEKASSKNENDLTSAIYLKKAGLACEAIENYKKALVAYEEIKSSYPNSEEARDIDKFIQAVKMKI